MYNFSSFLVFALLATQPSFMFGQEFIAYHDMKVIADRSAIGYEFNQMQHVFTYEQLPIVEKGLVIHEIDGELQMLPYDEVESVDVGVLREQVNLYLKESNTAKAKKTLNKILAIVPHHSEAMLFMGYALEIEDKPGEAISWYQKAIAINSINYSAYKALAYALLKKGEMKASLDAILHAHVLNRNDEKILNSLHKICEYNGVVYNNWEFIPQFQLMNGEGGSILVEYNGAPWKYYGLCRAIWDYEPGYDKKSTPRSNAFDLSMELECMNYAIRSYDNILDEIKVKIYPEFVAYNEALSKRFGAEYLLYEIKLQEDPYLGGLLNAAEMNAVVDYIKAVRIKKDASVKRI